MYFNLQLSSAKIEQLISYPKDKSYSNDYKLQLTTLKLLLPFEFAIRIHTWTEESEALT